LNHSKTEILPLGSVKYINNPINIKYLDEEINVAPVCDLKIGGVWFGHDKIELYNKNIKDRLIKMEGILNKWSYAKFTISGSIIISRTFGLSQFIHIMQSLHIDFEDLKKIESLIYRFIWRGPDKIKRDTLMKDYGFGGLKSLDIFSMNMILKLKNYYRLTFSNLDHPVNALWKNDLKKNNHGINYYVSKLDRKILFKYLSNKNERLHNYCLDCINYYRFYNSIWINHLNSLANNMQIHINYKLLFLFADLRSVCSKDTQDVANRLITRHNIATVADLLSNNNPNLFLDRLSVVRQIPKNITTSLNGNLDRFRNNNNNLDYLKLMCTSINSWKTFTKTNAIIIKSLVDNFDENIDHKFVLARKYTSNTQYRDFQFKLLHGIISTKAKLQKYKYINDNYCITCSESDLLIKDDIKHSMFDCEVSRVTWDNFCDVITEKFNVPIQINYDQVITGFHVRPIIINEIAIQIKKFLHKLMSIRKIITHAQIKNIIDCTVALNKANKTSMLNKIIN